MYAFKKVYIQILFLPGVSIASIVLFLMRLKTPNCSLKPVKEVYLKILVTSVELFTRRNL